MANITALSATVRSTFPTFSTTTADAITYPAGVGSRVRITNLSTTVPMYASDVAASAPTAVVGAANGAHLILPMTSRDFVFIGSDARYQSLVGSAQQYGLELL